MEKKKKGRPKKKPETKEIKIKEEKNKLVLKPDEQNIISNIVLNGDISKLNDIDKVKYYNLFCKSLGLNPATQPFQIITFQGGKQTLYATKDATEQLRKLNGVSITDSIQQIINDILVVKVKGIDKAGREDVSTGAVNVKSLYGDKLANAIMKAETKAKRRLTLSICGLGILDETEIETIQNTNTNKKFQNDTVIDTLEKDEQNINVTKTNNGAKVNPYFNEVINKKIITWKEMKELMIKIKLIQPGSWIVSELIARLKELTPKQIGDLKSTIEKYVNK